MFNIIVILLIILISFSIWNLISLRRLRKSQESKVQIADDRYYELKYKMEYITTIVIVVLSVGGYFGYQWFGSIKDDAAKNLKETTTQFESKFDSINFQLKVTDYKINNYDNKFVQFDNESEKIDSRQKNILVQQQRLDKNLNASNRDLKNVSSKIDEIKNKNILKQNFYIIDKLTFNTNEGSKIFYFHDYLTTSGDKLPAFTKPPFVSVSSPDGLEFAIINITTEYVELQPFVVQKESTSARFSLLLSEQ